MFKVCYDGDIPSTVQLIPAVTTSSGWGISNWDGDGGDGVGFWVKGAGNWACAGVLWLQSVVEVEV